MGGSEEILRIRCGGYKTAIQARLRQRGDPSVLLSSFQWSVILWSMLRFGLFSQNHHRNLVTPRLVVPGTSKVFVHWSTRLRRIGMEDQTSIALPAARVIERLGDQCTSKTFGSS